ncbi:MAG TPA: DinB family protein [Candidatus Methylomirabilis sp.]|nr:DinB family protein [Candidatus Methylomirabilis sp.]
MMDQAERDRYLAILRSTPERLKAVLAGVPRKLLTWRPAPGKWSIHEIVCHMRDAEREGYLLRYTKILSEDNPTFPDVDGDALALERQYDRLGLREVLRDWRAARKEVLAVLKKVKPDQWECQGTHESLGPMLLETILQRQALGNDEAHLGQIENVKQRWEILTKLQEAPKVLASLLRGVPDEVLRRKPAPEKWSMLEIACHLRDVERLFVERYGKVANHDRPPLRMINQDDLAVRLRYNRDDPAAALREFRSLRGETVHLLGALPHQSWQRIGLHPKRGEFSIAAHAGVHLTHDANHLNQIRALREGFGAG